MVAQTKTAEPTVVNGINVDDLFALIEGVRRHTAKGQTKWRVTTAWQGQTRSRTQVEGFEIGGERVPRRFSIDIDEPCELGGSNRFANPPGHRVEVNIETGPGFGAGIAGPKRLVFAGA